MSEFIYLDYNATTPLDNRVLEKMKPFWNILYANSSSVHLFGLTVKESLEMAEASIANNIGTKSRNIIFTSGATESINLALKGIKNGCRKHIVLLSTEHNAVIQTCLFLKYQGYSLTIIEVEPDGTLNIEKIKNSITEQTLIVCAMWVNNETGVLLPISIISEIAHAQGAYFLCDATQAMGKLKTNVGVLGIDLMPFSAHKFYGPKGIGGLYVSDELLEKLTPQINGGGQQHGFRSGTVNVPGIIGMSEALNIALLELEEESKKVKLYRDQLEKAFMALPNICRNGNAAERIYNTSNLCFPSALAEDMIIRLGNIAVSSGSACSAATTYPSHVLKAMGLSDSDTLSSIRFSLGRMTTEEDIEQCIEKLSKIYLQLIK